MSPSCENQIVEKVDKICARLQLLLGQWADSVPIISDASASTLISQFNLLSSTISKSEKKEYWGTHEMGFLLLQTLSQLWDKEENVSLLLKGGIVNSLKELHIQMSGTFLPMNHQCGDDNRFSEYLNLLTTITEPPSDISSKESWINIFNTLQETFLPLLIQDLANHPNTMVENKRQLCFTIIALFSSNPKTVIKIVSNYQTEISQLASTLFSHKDFPTQCTLLEILYRLYLIAHSLNNQTVLTLLSQHSPLKLDSLKQTRFIEDGRRLINQYNQQNNTGVVSVALSQLFIILPKNETSIGSVSWVDFGEETLSCYIEIEDETHAKELQLLSIRWSSVQSFDFIDRVFSLRVSFILPQNMDADCLLPFLTDRTTMVCLRFSFSQDVFEHLHDAVNQFTTKLSCSIQSIKPSTTPSEISLSQSVKGCKSSVVAMDQCASKKTEKTSIAIPAVTVVPETQDTSPDPTPLVNAPTELLFPDESHNTPPTKVIDVLSSLHSTPKRPETSSQRSPSSPSSPSSPKEETDDPPKNEMNKKLAGLSRRGGMSFLSQLVHSTPGPEKKMESGYTRKWSLPRKPAQSQEEENKENKENKDKKDKKELKTEKPITKQPTSIPTKTKSIETIISENTTEKPETSDSKSESNTSAQQPQEKPIAKPKPNEEKTSSIPKPRKTAQRKRATTTQIPGRKKTRASETIPQVKKAELSESSETSDVENETHALVDRFKTILSTPKYKLGDSTESSPLSNGSESDDDDPSILALQQAITTLLLQQKKEKEKQLQQTKRQLESSIKENAGKILHTSRNQLESILNKKKEEGQEIKRQIDNELTEIQERKEGFEKDIQIHLSKIQQLQNQYADFNKTMNSSCLFQSVLDQYTNEIEKMNTKLITDYKKKVKTVKKKSGQKKRSELQKLIQITFNSLADCE